MLATRPTPRDLPAVGIANSYWDAGLDANGVTNISEGSTTVTSVDTAANTYTRQRNDGRIDTWKNGVPSSGLRYRAPAGIPETIGMILANSGISVNSSNPFFSISVNRP